MGVDFYCGDKSFGCSYGSWNELRKLIIQATFNYIQDKFQKDYELYKDSTEDDENWIGEGSSYNCYKKDMIKIIEQMNLQSKTKNVFGMDNTINNLINLCINLSFVDALIHFDIGGLYSLCNKSDCEGYYSVGNSVDICQLFDLIEPFIKNMDENTHKSIYVPGSRYNNILYELFKESATTNKKIIIS